MKKVLRHLSYLLLFKSTKSRKQHHYLIKTATQEQLKALFESVANILHRNLELRNSHKGKLKKKALLFHKLSNRKVSVSNKIKLIFKNIQEICLFLSPFVKLLLSNSQRLKI